MNKYIVHINPIPGTDNPRTIEVESQTHEVNEGVVRFLNFAGGYAFAVAAFASGVWIYVEPKK